MKKNYKMYGIYTNDQMGIFIKISKDFCYYISFLKYYQFSKDISNQLINKYIKSYEADIMSIQSLNNMQIHTNLSYLGILKKENIDKIFDEYTKYSILF